MTRLFHFIIFISVLISVSCRKSDNKNSSNILSVPLSGEISTLDPANSYDVISASIVYQCYEQLFEYHYLKRPYTLKPLLSESLPLVENNGTKYTFKIRKGIKYHNDPVFKGKPRYVKAQDFITQIKRLAYLPTKSNGWWLFDGKIKGLNEFRKKVGNNFKLFKSTNVSGISAPDDHTLVIELLQPYPQMLYAFSMSFTSPIPMEVVEEYQNILNDKIIGTGPFVLDQWTRLSGLKLKRNPEYRDEFYPRQGDRLANSKGFLDDAGKKIPFLDGINFRIIKENQTRWLNFLSHKIDYLSNIPKDNFNSAIDSNGNLTAEMTKNGISLQIFPTLTFWWLSFNMSTEPFGKNKNLRLAIAHAIDWENYIKAFTNNIGLRSNSIYPPGIPGYNPSKQLPYKFDLKKAKHYLKLAGYPNGKNLPEIIFDVRGTSATQRQQAQFIKRELSKIGMEIKVVLNTFPAFLEKARNGKLQFWQDGWAMDYPDAENVLQLLVTKNHAPGPNVTFFSNKRFDQIFEKLKVLPNNEEKLLLMNEAENIILDEIPWIMQYYARNYVLFHKRLKNYRHSDLIYNNMKYLRLENN